MDGPVIRDDAQTAYKPAASPLIGPLCVISPMLRLMKRHLAMAGKVGELIHTA
jgi:hypothetical protein